MTCEAFACHRMEDNTFLSVCSHRAAAPGQLHNARWITDLGRLQALHALIMINWGLWKPMAGY